MTERKIVFANEKAVGMGLNEILKQNNAFIIGGVAIGLHAGRVNYRHHDDIDVICPSANHKLFYEQIGSSILNYSINGRFYYSGNQEVGVNVQNRSTGILLLHLLSFEETQEEYKFPFGLNIKKPFKLNTSLEVSFQTTQVASLELLLEMKKYAVNMGHMYESEKEKYGKDIKVLKKLLTASH
jgi:hypothetical protein